MNQIPIEDRLPELDVALQAALEAGDSILGIYEKKYETRSEEHTSELQSHVKSRMPSSA